MAVVNGVEARMQGGRRNGGYRGVSGNMYSQKREAEREVAAGFKNDQRNFGAALRRGVNVRAARF